MAELLAHSPNASGSWHRLVDHLESTGRLCGEFAAAFGSASAGEIVGRLHDLGKADPSWQSYLRVVANDGKASTVDHKTAGALVLAGWGLSSLAPVVVGHHGGLANLADVKARVLAKPTAGQAVAVSLVDGFGIGRPGVSPIPEWAVPDSANDRLGNRRLEFWTRMLFAALIDADRLDTAAFVDSARPFELANAPLPSSAARFDRSRSLALASRSSDPVAANRESIFHEVVSHASEPCGWFELTAPTGSGKTLAALGFALAHATQHGLRRVVSAVPFISVTEQVADAYRSVLETEGDEVIVLEHHSGVRSRTEAQAGSGLWSRLAAENWDANVIVTTTVRLLESMFENHTSDVRRLHRLANSVIIIDEVQSVPWRLMEPTLEVLRDLVRFYGCTVVLCTATQPPFHLVGDITGTEPTQLLDLRWFDEFRRVTVKFEPSPLEWPEIADRFSAEADANRGQCLAILNTIKDAKALTTELVGRDGLLHLSTRLCPAHRRHVLAEVLRRLDDGQPCSLVATQLIEAGVDLDFPVAFRAVAPMTALAQAAGRVNRHGKRDHGVLHVVDPSGGGSPPGEYDIGRKVALDLLRSGADPLAPGDLATYFDRFLAATRSMLDQENIQRERELHNFANVAERYRIIADDTTSVVVSYGGFDATQLVPPSDFRERRALNRRVQPYIVNLRTRDFAAAEKAKLTMDLAGGLHAWLGGYDPVFGLTSDRSTEALIW